MLICDKSSPRRSLDITNHTLFKDDLLGHRLLIYVNPLEYASVLQTLDQT